MSKWVPSYFCNFCSSFSVLLLLFSPYFFFSGATVNFGIGYEIESVLRKQRKKKKTKQNRKSGFDIDLRYLIKKKSYKIFEMQMISLKMIVANCLTVTCERLRITSTSS